MTQPHWIDVGAFEDVPLRGARCIRSEIGSIAVFRTSGGEIFAIDDRCPHKQGPLSQGIVHGNAVTCPLHNLVIDLESGEAQGPDGGSVTTFPVDVRDGRILLDVSAIRRARVA